MHDPGTSVSAPVSLVLLGEYALAFGGPALAVAVERRFTCTAQISNKFTVDGDELGQARHPYIRGALLHGWTDMDRPISFRTASELPVEWGWGVCGSAVACLGALSMFYDHIILEEVARRAFDAESDLNGDANPLDAVTSTYGSAIYLDSSIGKDPLWRFGNDREEWFSHIRDLGGIGLVLGDTGLPSPAAQMRDKVKRFHDTNSFARDIVRDLIGTVPEADEALRKRDMEGLGRIMSENQKLLVTLGVSHPTLDKLISAASRHSYGAKLVGPGGGGCIAALTDEPERTVEAINRAGGRGLMLPVSREGLRLENPEDRNNENGSGKDPDPR